MPKSKCCKAKIKVIHGMSDFIGDKNPTVCTMHYECCKCGKPCDILIPIRKEWKMNPKTRVQPNKKKDYKPKVESWID